MVRVGLMMTALLACSYNAPADLQDGQSNPDSLPDSMPPDTLPPDTQPQAFWTSIVGADTNGNSLTKTAPATGWGDAGASTSRSIASGDCFVEFTTAESTTGKALGLSRGDDSQSFNDIDFDFVLGANRKVYVYEGALLRGQVGTYVANDVFRVEIVAGVVLYRKNGALLFTSTLAPQYPVIVDAALFSPGATITNVVFDN